MIQIAVLGYGTVGSGVVEVINTNHDSINKRAENEINIKYVLDLRDFPGDPVEKVLVHDYEVIANDPEVDIVVEVMGGVEPVFTDIDTVTHGRISSRIFLISGQVFAPLTHGSVSGIVSFRETGSLVSSHRRYGIRLPSAQPCT